MHATVDELAQNRDPKGLYKKALAGEITGFTGVDDPYEAPENPELVLDTMTESPVESLQNVLDKLAELGYIEDPTPLMARATGALRASPTCGVAAVGHVVKEA